MSAALLRMLEQLPACFTIKPKLDRVRECLVDVVEEVTEPRTKAGKGSDRTEGDQSNDEAVLDQVLAFFAGKKGLHSDKHLEHEVIHLSLSPGIELFQPQAGVPVS
jgi:hypothetical protein